MSQRVAGEQASDALAYALLHHREWLWPRLSFGSNLTSDPLQFVSFDAGIRNLRLTSAATFLRTLLQVSPDALRAS